MFLFPPFSLNTDRYELTENSRQLALPRVAMELLLLLLQKRGSLVTRQSIANALWPGHDPDDVTQRINTAINRIRVTLNDNPEHPAFVQTVIGKGYRFIAEVEEQASPAPPLPTVIPTPGPPPGELSLEQLHAWYLTQTPIETSILRLDPQTSIVSLRGPLSLGAGLRIAEMKIQGEISANIRRMVIDLSHVPHIDSAGLGLLIHTFGLLDDVGGVLRLCGTPERVLHLFRMTHTDSYLLIDKDLSSSLAAFAGTSGNSSL